MASDDSAIVERVVDAVALLRGIGVFVLAAVLISLGAACVYFVRRTRSLGASSRRSSPEFKARDDDD